MTVPLNVHRWGGGPRRVLLLHGVTSAGSGWWRVGRDLAGLGWAVAAPDLRGHGESPRASSYGFAEAAEDLRAVGDGWDAVLGHSMGGAIATLAASDPAFTRRLVLQDPALIVSSDIDEVLTWLLDDFSPPMTPEQAMAAYPWYHPEDARLKALTLGQTTAGIVEQIARENMPWNVLAEAAALEVDTVVLGSDPLAGGIFPVAVGEWLAAANPRVAYRMLEGAPHSVHRHATMYDAYLAAVVEALGADPEEGA